MEIVIKRMSVEDVNAVFEAFESWNKTRQQYGTYLNENLQGGRTTLLALFQGRMVGYGNLLITSYYAPFRDAGIPEINDLNVVRELQGKGIGTRIICELEKLARNLGYPAIGIGVGLTPVYSKAQR